MKNNKQELTSTLHIHGETTTLEKRKPMCFFWNVQKGGNSRLLRLQSASKCLIVLKSAMISFLFLLQREEGPYLSKGPFKDEPSMNMQEFFWRRNDIRKPPPIGRLPMRGAMLKSKKKFPPFWAIRWNKWWRVSLLLKDTILGMERNWNRLLVVAERESASKCNSNPQASHEWDNFFSPLLPRPCKWFWVQQCMESFVKWSLRRFLNA